MKLHLPKLLRNAVLACITAVAGISTTVGTATVSGVALAALAAPQQAAAAELTAIATMDQLVAAGTMQGNVVNKSGNGYSSYYFDGNSAITNISNADVVSAITSSSASSRVVVAAWVKVDSGSGLGAMFGYGGQSNGFMFCAGDGNMKLTTKGLSDFSQSAGDNLSAGDWQLVAVTLCVGEKPRFHVGTASGSYYTHNSVMNSMNATGEEAAFLAIGSGNAVEQGGALVRDAFKGEIQNLTIFTANGAVNTSDIAAIMGTTAPSLSAIDWISWNTANADNTWSGANWGSPAAAWTAGGAASFSGAGETVQITEDIAAAHVTLVGTGWAFSGEGTLTVENSLTVGDGTQDTSLNLSNYANLASGTLVEVKNLGTLNIGANDFDNVKLYAGATLEMNTGAEVDYDTIKPVSHDAGSKLVITGSGTSVYTTNSGSNGFFKGYVSVTDGACLELRNVDSLGYDGGATKKVTIKDATLALAGRTTFNTDIEMLGGAIITSSSNNSGIGTESENNVPILQVHRNGEDKLVWTVSGTGNKVESGVRIRMNQALGIDVAEGGELTIEGTTDRTEVLTKSGAGVLALSGSQFADSVRIEVTGGKLRLDGTYDRAKETILTNGGLEVSATGVVSLSSLSGYGTVEVKTGGSLTLNAVDVTASQTLVVNGNVSAGRNFACTGEGALQVNGVLSVAEGVLTMNGVNLAATSFDLSDGAELIYGKGAVLGLGTISSAVTLNVYNVLSSMEAGIDTGISATDATLDSLKQLITVAGYDSSALTYEIRDGRLWLSSSAQVQTDWDINWGSCLSGTPATVVSRGLEDSDFEAKDAWNVVNLSGSTFDNNGVIAVELTANTKQNTVVLGGILDAEGKDAYGETLEKEVWIKATGGSYSMIAGGSWNAWYSANNPKWGRILNGDTHIMVDGAEVDNIIGGHYQEDFDAVHEGDTYISVYTDTVKGFIVGSGTTCHLNTVTQNGDTHIFIYTPLSSDATNIPNQDKLVNDVRGVIGASVKVANGYGSTAVLNGNTHITIDIDNAAEGAQFNKIIVGGHYCWDGEYVETINGSTYVTIDAENVAFTQDVIAGSRQDSSNSSISGSTNLSIKGGNFTTDGKTVYGGSVLEAAAGELSVGSANVAIEGGTIARLVGGCYIGNSNEAAVNGSVGDIAVTITGGEVQSLIGGTTIERNKADGTYAQGNISINLQGGTVGDVYAAGEQKRASKLTATSTSVTIGSNVTIANGKTISGGYKLAEGATGSTVTGDSTLVLSGAQDRSGVIFKDFNKISATAAATVGTLSNTAAVTKTGAGVLTLGAATNSLAGGLTVSEGGLATGTASTLGGALTMNNGTSLNLSGGALTLAGDAGAALSLTGVALTLDQLSETNVLMSGVSSLNGYTSGEVAASTYFSSIAGVSKLDSSKVKLENGNLILMVEFGSTLVWDTANSNWAVDEPFSSDADFIEGDKAYFNSLGTAGGVTESVTISGTVKPSLVSITAGEGNTYSFTSSAGGKLVASNLTIGAGTAQFGAGSISLADISSLTVNGTLDITALGTDLNLIQKLASEGTTGDGTVKIALGWATYAADAVETLLFDVNIEAVDAIEILRSGGSMQWDVTKSIKVVDGTDGEKNGDVLVGRHVNMTVKDGGSIDAVGAIKLGNSSEGEAESNIGSVLKLEDGGSIKADSIAQGKDWNNRTYASSFEMEGGTLELTGTDGIASPIAVEITGGTLKAGANSWGITGTMTDGASNASIGGATIETGSGSITIENANLTSALTNKGNLTLAGTINIVDTRDSAWAPTPVAGSAVFKDGAGAVNAAGNGFCYSTMNYTIIGEGSTGATTADGVTWQLNGAELATGSGYLNGVLTVVGSQAEADRGVFYVNSGVVNCGGTGAADMTGATSIRLSGGELVLNQAPSIGIVVDAASSLTIASGVTLSHGSLSGQNNTNKVTMKGAGATAVYAMGSVMNATGLDFTSSDYWKGTVTIDDVTTINTRYLDNLGNAGSVISINGLSGWLERSSGVMAHIILREKGLTMTDNSGDGSAHGKNYIYKGGVSGKGNFTLATTSTNAPVFEFTGDMDKWEGGFVVNQAEGSTAAPNVTVRFNGGGNLFAETVAKGVVLNRKGTLNLTVGNTTSATIMRAGITNTAEGTININTVGTTSLNGVLSNTGTGAINLTNSGMLSLVNDTTLSRLSNSSSITASGKTLTVTGGISGIETSGVTTCGSITAGALTLQGAANNVETLELTGALTLGTADVASKLTAGTLDVGSITVNKLADGLMDVTEIASSSLTLNIDAQVLLTHFSQADTKSLVLLTADTLTTEPTLTLNITNKDTDDNRYTYTLAWDGQNMVLSSDPNGQKWVGTAGNNIWSTDGSWDGGAPQATDSVVFAGAGCSDVILDGQLAVEDVIIHVESGSTTDGYVFNAKTDASGATLPSSLDITKNLSVNNGSLDVGDNVDITVTEHTDVLESGELNILAGGSVSALSGISNAGTVTIAAASASGGNAGTLSVQNGGSVQNSGTMEVNGSLLAGEGLQHNASGSDIINSGTITNTGSIIADGNLTNSGVLAQNSGSIKVYGDATNTGADIATPDSGEKPAGMTIAGGTVDILGDLTNSNSINQTGGSVVVGGVLSNSGSITVTGEGASVTLGAENTAATTDSLENTGSLTVDDGAAVTVNGSLDNTGGTIIIGTAAIADGDPGTEGDQPVAATTGTLEVTGNLTGTGGADKLVVNESSELTVGGDLEAADVELAFGGNVTVGGKATVENLTIADTATFTADAAKITGTLANNGEITVGSYDAQGNLVGDADTVLDINKLTGSGKVTVAEGGTLKIASATDFTGELKNLGSITVEQGVTISTVTEQGGNITAPSLTIGGLMKDVIDPDTQQPVQEYVSANGTVLGDVATESIIIDTLDHTAGPHLTLGSLTGKLSATDTDNKVQITLTELGSSEGVDKLIANGEKDYHLLSIGGTVSLDDLALVDNLSAANEQKLWKSGLKLGDLTASSTMALRAASTNVSISVSNQSLEEATWDTAGETTKIGLDLGTLTNGTMVLLENDMLDKVQSVNVTSDVTLDLVNTPNALDSQVTAPVAVNINGLQGGKKLTIKGNGDTVNLTTLANKFSGTVELTGKVTANMGAAANTAMKGATIVAMGDTVTLNGTLTNGELVVSQDKTANGNLQLANSDVKVVIAADSATLDNEQLKAPIADLDSMSMKSGAEGTVSIGTYDASGNFVESLAYNKYYTNIRMEGSKVLGDRNTSYYSDKLAASASSANGKAGLELADGALVNLNAQTDQDSTLGDVLDTLDAMIATGDKEGVDELGAALAGASTAVLGMAVSGDVERQLQAIRNRTTTMGVDQGVVNPEMPYFNAWINAESDNSELSDNVTEGGYKLNSWGGTVGFDVDFTPTLTAGLALTAMYGDLTVSGADAAKGDLDTYYVSAFARYSASAWTHTFVATAGLADLSLDRTVMGEKVEGETDGLSFGLMYEVGRVFALNEDATACLQPILNVSWRHTELDGYSEKGGDLALDVDKQSYDTVTFGLGARLQAVVGESMYNRTSIFECRLLAKLDTGDTQGTSEVGLAGATAEVESAERGAFGLEAGAGLTIPLGEEGSSIFADASIELRSEYSNVNGTVGYRINF